MANQTREALQYGLTEGLPALRQALSDLTEEEGVPSTIDNVVITSGSQQALDLMGRLFLDEGDTVLVESPTFVGALQSFNAYGVRYAPVPLDDGGVCLDLLEEALRDRRPKFMYIQPNFQNPMGVSLSLERRVRLVELADAYGVPILEDDPYGQLRFSGEPLPSLLALDAARHPENAAAGRYVAGNVVHLGSFSKTLTPGLRVAWAVAPVELAQQFVMAKQGSDLHTSALGQAMAAEFLRRGWLPAQVERIRRTYLERRDAMIAALEEYLPAGVQYTRPEGGLFLWMTLPEGIDTVPLLSEAAAQRWPLCRVVRSLLTARGPTRCASLMPACRRSASARGPSSGRGHPRGDGLARARAARLSAVFFDPCPHQAYNGGVYEPVAKDIHHASVRISLPRLPDLV